MVLTTNRWWAVNVPTTFMFTFFLYILPYSQRNEDLCFEKYFGKFYFMEYLYKLGITNVKVKHNNFD